jgi:hypothetical protein
VCARAEPIDWSVATKKLKLRRILVEAEFLEQSSTLQVSGDAERIRLHFEHPCSPMRGLPRASSKDSDAWIRPESWSQAAVSVELVHGLTGCSDSNAQDVVTYGGNGECKDRRPRNLGCERTGGGQVQLEEYRGAARPNTFDEASTGKAPRHLFPPGRDRKGLRSGGLRVKERW